MSGCRACGVTGPDRVLDLGAVPAADDFPPAGRAAAGDTRYALAMDLCRACGLAQLADDDTVADEPRGVEPQALRDQAAEAIRRVQLAGWLTGSTIREFGSPHGGTWLRSDAVSTFGPPGNTKYARADVVLDVFGIMHEPDQRAAFAERAAATAPEGVLLLQFHSLETIVRAGQWNGLRHGHFAYYSLTALTHLLDAVGMSACTAWEFDLYGGTVLVGIRHGRHDPDSTVRAILRREDEFGVCDAATVGRLQAAADTHLDWLRGWLRTGADAGLRTFAYGAASRAVALFAMAGADRRLLAGVADASPAKQGRRMPGTDVPIIAPDELVAAAPDRVLLTVADLYPEVHERFPELDGRWQLEPA